MPGCVDTVPPGGYLPRVIQDFGPERTLRRTGTVVGAHRPEVPMTPLEQAARAAQHAPSVFNTQPWRWRITGESMELFADSDRRVDSIDRDSRLLLLSCGTALHHARTHLGVAG
jgi:hypothetical protein